MKITKTLVLATAMLLCSQIMKAGDGTKENPYTVAELNATKESITDPTHTILFSRQPSTPSGMAVLCSRVM